MQASLFLLAVLSVGPFDDLGPGDYRRTIDVDGLKRSHRVHVPPKYDRKIGAPLVLALHGASMWDKIMEDFTGLNATADEHNFIVVYPNGTGIIQTWNAGKFPGELLKGRKIDDVKYLGKVLDDIESVLKIDRKRIYATGMSNGGMMAYRLASEMSDRIAAIAPIAGTMAVEKYEPKRPVPVLHIHGTRDPLVPYDGPEKKGDAVKLLGFRSVDDTIAACVKANGCDAKPMVSELDAKADKIKVTRKVYRNGKEGSEVILYVLENGGHVWPSSILPVPAVLGASTRNISANRVVWEFFSKHALK